MQVLIESDWNLKYASLKIYEYNKAVLIESDWNLKLWNKFINIYSKLVLIESDWNLKRYLLTAFNETAIRINRIRLEFKED